jgi:hypothetical protein
MRLASAMKRAEYPIKYSIEYSEAEVKECLYIDEEQKDVDSQMQKLRGFIGINIDGWMPADHYGEAKEREQSIKQQTLEAAETDDERSEVMELWPFQDHEEID